MITSEVLFMEVARSKTQYQEVILRLKNGESISNVIAVPPQDMTVEQVIAASEKVVSEAKEAMKEYDQKYNSDRKGNWNPTYMGHRFWPEDPKPRDIDIRDISHALSRINRFNGHTRKCYSVAQHSVLVSRLLPPSLALFGLLHDAGECYLGDVITPIKRLIREFYEPLEERVMQAVADRYYFSMNEQEREEVKIADRRLLYTEIRDLVPSQVCRGDMLYPPLSNHIGPVWSPDKAEKVFLYAYLELTNCY